MRLSLLIILILSGPLCLADGRSCNEYLASKASEVPWVEAGVSNFPFAQMGYSYGVWAVLPNGKKVIARECTWCPTLATKIEAEKWLNQEVLGQRTLLALRTLIALGKKNLADHTHGLTLRDGRLFFISKIPEGPPLSYALKFAGNQMIDKNGSVNETSAIKFRPGHVETLMKIKMALSPNNELDPLNLVEYNFAQSDHETKLSDILGAIEFTVLDESVRLSFFDLSKVFKSSGQLKAGFFYHNEPSLNDVPIFRESISFWQLTSASLVIANSQPFLAYSKLLRSKTIYYGYVFNFIKWIHSDLKSADPFLKQLRTIRIPMLTSAIEFDWGKNNIQIFKDGEIERFNKSFKFASEQLLMEHFHKHGREVKSTSPEQYVELANQFLRGENIAKKLGSRSVNERLVYSRPHYAAGDTIVMDIQSGIVAVVSGEDELKTFFINSKQISGMGNEQYFMEQVRKQVSHHFDSLDPQILRLIESEGL